MLSGLNLASKIMNHVSSSTSGMEKCFQSLCESTINLTYVQACWFAYIKQDRP